MKQISPNPSLTKRGSFAFLTMLVKCQQYLKLSALLRELGRYSQIVSAVPRLFDDYRIVSPLVTQLTQGWK